MKKYISKTSSHTYREQMVRDEVLAKRMRAEGHKAELLALAYGGEPTSVDGKLLKAGFGAEYDRAMQAHTSEGDFSHLFTHGIGLGA